MEIFKHSRNKKICIVANDAGGAMILKYLVYFSKSKFSYILTGPAKNIFNRKNSKQNYRNIIDSSDFVITGTSYKSLTEYNCIKYCKKINKKVYSVLDHWINYKIRFLRNRKYVFPDKIIVCDKDAKKIASKEFKNISYMSNPYWRYIKKKFIKKNNLNKDYLFVSSNYDRLKKKNSDISILKKLLSNLKKNKFDSRLFIRRHPSETNAKFNNYFLINKSYKIYLDKNKNLIDSFKGKKIIFGHNSMALVIGKICGLKTVNINIKDQANTLPSKYIDKFI
jgi:hypothetical protein